MTDNKDQNVVIAIFDNEDWLEPVTDRLKNWDQASSDINLGAIGTITKEDGQIKTHVGHKTRSGVKTGAVVGIIAAVLSGGLTLVGGIVGGAVLGGLTGTFFKKSLHLSKDEIEALGAQLDAGKAALVVTCDDHEVEPTAEQLRLAGGTVMTYTVPDEALEEATQAMEEADRQAD
jgi:uncharacterized membrane protein